MKTSTIQFLVVLVFSAVSSGQNRPDAIRGKTIESLTNIEVWAGAIKEIHLNGLSKKGVVSPIHLTNVKLVSPTSELSPFSKTCVDQLEAIPGKKDYYISTYFYYDEAEEFPNGRIPEVGEIWIVTCRRGIDGGLHFLSGARLEENSNPSTKTP